MWKLLKHLFGKNKEAKIVAKKIKQFDLKAFKDYGLFRKSTMGSFLESLSFKSSYKQICTALHDELQTLKGKNLEMYGYNRVGYLVLVNIITKMRIEIKNIKKDEEI